MHLNENVCEIMKKLRKRYESVQKNYFIGQNVRRDVRYSLYYIEVFSK